MSELRWNKLLGEWVATATHRNARTFLPASEFCPLCPTQPGGFETEIPEASYEIAVLQNRFPSLSTPPPEPSVETHGGFLVAPALGACEVVLYTPDHQGSLADLSVERVRDVIEVWADRTSELGSRPDIAYVYIFENKGEEMGVTLHHPHGQIYAYPFVPPVVLREIERFAHHDDENATCLLCDVREDEVRDNARCVVENESFTAYVPFAARWPYEVHVTSVRHLGSLPEMHDAERDALADVLSRVVRGYDHLFSRPFPYVMAVHQAPIGSMRGAVYHFHIEFYPPLRSERRVKFLAGSELGAGMFINDTVAEETARQLREVMR
jgi:UDPglucose--hexose-1-phosphate uridylyltransferase